VPVLRIGGGLEEEGEEGVILGFEDVDADAADEEGGGGEVEADGDGGKDVEGLVVEAVGDKGFGVYEGISWLTVLAVDGLVLEGMGEVGCEVVTVGAELSSVLEVGSNDLSAEVVGVVDPLEGPLTIGDALLEV